MRSVLPPSSSLTAIFGCGANSSLPLGPSTRTLPSASWIFTPAGTATGCLPIRDMANAPLLRLRFFLGPRDSLTKAPAESPHIAQEFAADTLGASLAVAQDAPV